MRALAPEFAAHLASGTTSQCRCWRVTRADGTVLGFTDHDADIAFENTVFKAETGLDAAEATAQLGLAVGGGDVAGALSAQGLDADGLARGLWDSATVEVFAVNWQSSEQRLRLWVGEIGEVKRQGAAFSAELRGLMHRLDARAGRLFASGCDACLGDARCGVPLGAGAYTGNGAVLEVDSRLSLSASGLDGFANGWFTHGVLRWSGGNNANLAVDVREHRKNGSTVTLGLWQPMPDTVSTADAFTITAGCDRRFDTCRTKFGNAVNFRGFPHMPGTDAVLSYPSSRDGDHNGGSFFA
jgi:uncharacterized phage protein (TIGR02218 family)